MQAEQARAMAEQALIEAEAQRRRAETLGQRNLATDPVAASPARREFELSISQDGTVSVGGQFDQPQAHHQVAGDLAVALSVPAKARNSMRLRPRARCVRLSRW